MPNYKLKIALLAVALIASAQIADVAGFSGTRWGMTPEEAMATGLALTPRPMPAVMPKIAITLKAFIGPEIEVEGRKFATSFSFDIATSKLVSVILGPVDKDSIADFRALESGLTSKYGPPVYSVKNGEPDETTIRRWAFPSTTIELRYTDLALASRITRVSLSYEPAKKNAL